MLQSPGALTPKQKLKWKEKIRRLSSPPSNKSHGIYASFLRTPKESPSLPSFSNSATLTPGSCKQSRLESGQDLTRLDVLDQDHEVNYLLSNQVGMNFGDSNIPPPPPRKASNMNTNKLQLLPANVITGPKIKPFYTKCLNIDSNLNQDSCFICKDMLEMKLDSEKLVLLDCGDCIHGECLQTIVDMSLEDLVQSKVCSGLNHRSLVEEKVLPICSGKRCISEGKSMTISPISKDVIPDLLKDVMLSLKLKRSQSPMFAEDCEVPLTFGSENRVSKHFIKVYRQLRPKSKAGRFSQHSHEVISEKKNSCRNFSFDSELDLEKGLIGLLEQVKNKFIKHMLDRYVDFDLVVLVSLGSLRLVDWLQVSLFGDRFERFIVYLFSNFIVIETDGLYPKLFPLDHEHIITTPETSVLQLVTVDGHTPVLKLFSETDAVIEKWGIALSDNLLKLPADVITSSIEFSDLETGEQMISLSSKQNQIVKGSSQRGNICHHRFHLRTSTVLIIEPKEIWSECAERFQEELMKIGVIPISVPRADNNDTQSTSPLNIIRKRMPTSPCLGMEHQSISSSDFESDSDMELICEIMKKHGS